jgi:hypothetical protein
MTTLSTAATADAGCVDPVHLRALLAADVRRLGPPFARSVAGVLALVALAMVTGIGNRGMVTGLVGAVLVMYSMFLALQLVKDKLDGHLAFLCALPTRAPAPRAACREARRAPRPTTPAARRRRPGARSRRRPRAR